MANAELNVFEYLPNVVTEITEDRTDLKFGVPTTDSRVGKVPQGYAGCLSGVQLKDT
jgi:hypothetical protein